MSISIPLPPRPRAASLPAVPVAATADKAGPLGVGAGPLMTRFLLPQALGDEPQQRIAKALELGRQIDWVRAAERLIAAKVTGCEWHLEDPDGVTIDDEYPDKRALDAIKIIEAPQGEIPLTGEGGIGRRMTRRQFLTLTSRQSGLAGTAAWYLDMIDGNGIPHALCYVRADRLTPKCSDNGTLLEWRLDKRPGFEGTPIPVDRLVLIQFEPPDQGVFGVGLIESAMAKAINSGLVDTHWSSVLSSGGRISGILSPKSDAIEDDNVYGQLVRDWRNIVEQPDAARRLQIVRAPVEFTSTIQSMADLQIIHLMERIPEALLALWGVPLTQLGGKDAQGLNSGESRKYDEAALWQGAVHNRLEDIQEAYQTGILDKYESVLGWAPCLVNDEPAFDDETPAYDRAAKAVSVPLRNRERRAILGLDPTGDPLIDNTIMLPVNMVAVATAPDEDTGQPVAQGSNTLFANPEPDENGGEDEDDDDTDQVPDDGKPSGPGGAAKASALKAVATLDLGARRLRDRMEATIVPAVTAALERRLAAQGDAIADAVERNWASISAHGGRDESQWWRPGELEQPLRPAIVGVAETVSEHISRALATD